MCTRSPSVVYRLTGVPLTLVLRGSALLLLLLLRGSCEGFKRAQQQHLQRRRGELSYNFFIYLRKLCSLAPATRRSSTLTTIAAWRLYSATLAARQSNSHRKPLRLMLTRGQNSDTLEPEELFLAE